jgi:hypothetical protein
MFSERRPVDRGTILVFDAKNADALLKAECQTGSRERRQPPQSWRTQIRLIPSASTVLSSSPAAPATIQTKAIHNIGLRELVGMTANAHARSSQEGTEDRAYQAARAVFEEPGLASSRYRLSRAPVRPFGLRPAKLLGDVFLALIKAGVAPLVFLTIVHGIASAGDVKSAGRDGWRSIVYFEVVSTIALMLGLMFGNLLAIGKGMATAGSAAIPAAAAKAAPQGFAEFVMHVVPDNFVGAFAKGELLQVVVLAVMSASEFSRSP